VNMEPTSGLLVLHKKKGVESTQMCNRVKYLFEQGAGVRVKVGHGGTLDPMATGVMVFGVGHGTKLLHSKLGDTKGYHATAKLGTATNTLDSGEGGKPGAINHCKVTETAAWEHLSMADLAKASVQFQGEILQRLVTSLCRVYAHACAHACAHMSAPMHAHVWCTSSTA
jgi:tRNA pseudouridine55 synthase